MILDNVAMSMLLAIMTVVAQTAAGSVWWLALRNQPRMSWSEVVGMGIALGSIASLLVGVVLRPLLGPWGLVAPAIVTLAIVIARLGWLRARINTCQFPPAHLVAVAIGILAGLTIIIGNWMRVPLSAITDASYADIYFQEALARSIATSGPGPSIFMVGGELPYHWFVYGWIGQIGEAAGSEPFVMLTRLLPVVAVIAMVLLAIAWTTLLPIRARALPRWVPALAALLVVFAGYPGALYGSILNFDSPSQSIATVWLLGFGVALVQFLNGGSRALVIAVALLALALVGGKVSHAAVAAAGLTLLFFVGLIVHAPWVRRAGVVLLVSALTMGLAYLWVLRGAALEENITEALAVKASTWQGLDPVLGRWGVPLGTIGLLLAMLARPAGLIALLARKTQRTDPAVLWTVGCLIAGLGAVIVLREGINETWFILAASAPAGALSAVGIGVAFAALARDGLARPMLMALLIAIPISLVVMILSWNWPVDPESPAPRLLPWLATITPWLLAPIGAWILLQLRGATSDLRAVIALALGVVVLTSIGTRPAAAWTAQRPVLTQIGVVQPSTGEPAPLPPGAPDPQAVDADRIAALQWLALNADPTAIVATTNPISAQIPAITGLRTYLSGALYQAGLGPTGSRMEVERRLEVLAGVASQNWNLQMDDLCAAGVDYLWVEGDAPIRRLTVFAFASTHVSILEQRAICDAQLTPKE